MRLEPSQVDRYLTALEPLDSFHYFLRALRALQAQERGRAHQVLELPGDVTIAHEGCVEARVTQREILIDMLEQIERILQVLLLVRHRAQVRVGRPDAVIQVRANNGQAINEEALPLLSQGSSGNNL